MNKARARGVVLVGVCALVFTSYRARAREANALQILTGFSSKETCSCAFVVEQTDEYCQAFGQQAGFDVTVAIDRSAKTVTSTFMATTRKAVFTEGLGCVGDALP